MIPPVVLHIEKVTARYQGSSRNALENCSFDLREGEHVALLGLNGSGKTSLLMAAAGLVPFQGVIDVDGIRISEQSLAEVRRKLGFLFSVPDDQLLFPRVVDDVAFSLKRQGVGPEEAHRRSERMLAAMGIGDLRDSAPYELSHGQKMRVALAGALVHEPRLLLLDEPSGALDPPGKRSLASFFNTCASAMLIATHDLAFATECCSRYIILDGGKVVRDTVEKGEIEL
jgi:cobalt/nickel transport system ATP-binding protein